jgi:hypothetical protein
VSLHSGQVVPSDVRVRQRAGETPPHLGAVGLAGVVEEQKSRPAAAPYAYPAVTSTCDARDLSQPVGYESVACANVGASMWMNASRPSPRSRTREDDGQLGRDTNEAERGQKRADRPVRAKLPDEQRDETATTKLA